MLAALDQAVIPVLQHSESRHYQALHGDRFPESDLFPLGPLVEYLQEHPRGQPPRVAFLGDSRVWGYLLEPDESIPAAFQRLTPDVQVLNLGINRFRAGSSFLVSKQLLDSVECFYLFFHDDPQQQQADPLLPTLIPVDPEDAARFGLRLPSRPQRWFDDIGRRWRLARYSYRLQAAWFGTSTRQFCYLTLRRLMAHHSLTRHATAVHGSDASSAAAAVYRIPMQAGPLPPDAQQRLAQRYPFLWRYAELLAHHRVHGFFIELAQADSAMPEEDAALVNAQFRPYVAVVRLAVPTAWLMDDHKHVTAEGAAGIARSLAQMTHAYQAEH